MKDIKSLYDEYKNLIKERTKNRKKINMLIKNNQIIKKRFNIIKEKLINTIIFKINNKYSLYKICKESFGVVDSRFYTLYQIILNKIKRKRK